MKQLVRLEERMEMNLMNELNSKLQIGKQGIITPKELSIKINQETPYLLDIRKREDYDHKKIEGTIHSEWEDVVDLIQDDVLPRNRTIVVVCYNGQSSMQISTILNIQGYHALSLMDGMEGWLLEDLKIVAK